MRTAFVFMLFLLLLPLVAWSDDFICEDTQTPGKYRRYQPSQDPSTLLLQPEEACHAIPEADLPAQRAACMDGTTPPPTIPLKYRMVSGERCVEMPQGGQGPLTKNAVDAAENALKAQTDAYTQEKGGPECGEKQLAQLTSKLNQQKGQKHAAMETARQNINAAIDAMSKWDLSTGQAMLKQIVDDIYTQENADIDDHYKWDNDLYRCLRAYIGIR